MMKNIQEITSAANPLIRLTSAVVHTYRRAAKEGLFTVEGLRLAETAASSDWKIRHVLVTERALSGERTRALVDTLIARGTNAACVTEAIFSTIAETEHPQGIVLLMERKRGVLLDALCVRGQADAPLCIALDRVQDPGNVGTILRTADAVGASAVILLRGSADVYSGKVIRATMGSLFHIPFAEGISAEELIRFAGSEGMDLLAAACDANAKPHFSADLCRPAIIVFGNEANGVSEEILTAAEPVYIPMRGRAESLNVATAATAVLYEALRQRFCTQT